MRTRVFVVSTAVLLLASACGYHPDTTVVHLSDPGDCVPVDVASAPETAALLAATASRFNGSAAARLPDEKCAYVRIETVDSPVALNELVAGWPDAERLGPAPVAWVPGSTMWGELLDARLTAKHRPALAPNGTPFAHTPLVIAMPAPMAKALGYPRRPVAWKDLEQLARNPRGWGAFGHPEWGPFRLGKGNPNWSTTGLDQTVALDASDTAATDAKTLERAVEYYGDSTQVYFDTWQRLAAKSTTRAMTYLSAVITDERSVVAYNAGHAQADVALGGHPTRVPLPLVAVYPKDGTIESDHPIVILDAPWASKDARAGARLFRTFALQPAAQAEVAAAGYRPGRGSVRRGLVAAVNGVDPAARINPVAPASPNEIVQALAHWQANRRRARVLFLFDVSDSMGDPADPAKPDGPSKLALARAALSNALGQLAPDDQVGLRIFTTKLANPASPNWLDLVPIGPLATREDALQKAIMSLERQQGSPLYAATRDAFDAISRRTVPARINAVVVLSDGYNEVDHDNDEEALLTHLAKNPNVHVFTVTYSNDADGTALRRIAQATNAWNFDARAVVDIPDVLPRVLASF